MSSPLPHAPIRRRFGLGVRPFLAGVSVAAAIGVSVPATAQIFGLSEEDEIELGRQASAEIEKDLTLLDDEGVITYVSELGQRLAARSGRPNLAYQFRVVDAPDINAFALPGGFIYVNRGLIEAADNESELAGVLGHEIAHVAARHGADQAQRAQLAGLGLSALDRLLGQGARAQVAGLAAQMVTAGTFMRFSRDAEREADRLGAQIVIDTGYDPLGMVTFFEKLAALRERQPNAVERFFASHPDPSERVGNIDDLIAASARPGDRRVDTRAFDDARRRLLALPRPEADAEPPSAANADPTPAPVSSYASEARDREIAAVFAPVFYQALGPDPRYDYITAFDFDGDWRGDNNWNNAGDPGQRLAAQVYYGVAETDTHFLVFYAVFHPRDYKGGNERGALLSEVIREAARLGGQYDPTGLSQDAVLAHENDLEGALVVAEKRGDEPGRARVEFVEALAHNAFLKYTAGRQSIRGVEEIETRSERPELYIEPKGHGIGAYRGDAEQRASAENGFITYVYGGRAEVPRAGRTGRVDYDLAPIYHTLWLRAFEADGSTFDEVELYEPARWEAFSAVDTPPVIGRVGSAFRGTVGGRNIARPPWGWFDASERDRPLGEWFFDPAGTIKRHFDLGASFSTDYVHHPFLGVFRDAAP